MKTQRNSPIGVIDSGIGGLSLLKILVEKYPHENYIYLADNLNMPYGNKSVTFLKNRLLELVNYLHTNFNVKLVIFACNTASVSALEYVNKHSPVKVLGLDIKPLINNDYKILCSKLTSKRYKDLNTYPCPKLASNIEDNIFDLELIRRTISRLMKKANITENNIVLGCTHYELILNEFKMLYSNKNFMLPCKEFVKNFSLTHPNISNVKGDILMLSTLATKSYIDKLWKVFKR